MRTITTLTDTRIIMEITTGIIMEAITEVMDTTHTVAMAVVIGMAAITVGTTTAPDITRAIRLSSSDCRFPSLFRSPRSKIGRNHRLRVKLPGFQITIQSSGFPLPPF